MCAIFRPSIVLCVFPRLHPCVWVGGWVGVERGAFPFAAGILKALLCPPFPTPPRPHFRTLSQSTGFFTFFDRPRPPAQHRPSSTPPKHPPRASNPHDKTHFRSILREHPVTATGYSQLHSRQPRRNDQELGAGEGASPRPVRPAHPLQSGPRGLHMLTMAPQQLHGPPAEAVHGLSYHGTGIRVPSLVRPSVSVRMLWRTDPRRERAYKQKFKEWKWFKKTPVSDPSAPPETTSR